MKMHALGGLVVLVAFGLAPLAASAQTAPPPAFTVLPPPSINSPGAVPVAPPSSVRSAVPAPVVSTAASGKAIPLPPLPSMRETTSRDGRGQPPPTVKVIKHKDTIIEEYYQGGTLYMVHVRPKHGVPYSYYVDKAHKLSRGPGAPPVNPVMYTILQWGNPDDSH